MLEDMATKKQQESLTQGLFWRSIIYLQNFLLRDFVVVDQRGPDNMPPAPWRTLTEVGAGTCAASI